MKHKAEKAEKAEKAASVTLYGFSHDKAGSDAWFHTKAAARRFAAACGWTTGAPKYALEERESDQVDAGDIMDTAEKPWRAE